jgi:hypothetical protein
MDYVKHWDSVAYMCVSSTHTNHSKAQRTVYDPWICPRRPFTPKETLFIMRYSPWAVNIICFSVGHSLNLIFSLSAKELWLHLNRRELLEKEARN